MARRKTPRRGFVPGMVRFEEPEAGIGSTYDAALFELAARLRFDEQAHDEAMDELATAEQRFAELSEEHKHVRRSPTWLRAAQDREATTGAALENIYREIAKTSARTKSGLAIKLQIITLLYGESIDDVENNKDMVLVLLQSLITDCSG